MRHNSKRHSASRAKALVFCGLAAMVLAAAAPASAGKTFTTLYEFAGDTDGGVPFAPVIRDAGGNLYGTTYFGGDLSVCGHRGCGVVFKLAPDGTETVLHAFAAGHDGSHPTGALFMDGKGNLYGTTQNGGGNNACRLGCGTVFKIAAADGHESVLHAFAGRASDGGLPLAGVIKDNSGNLYGTTSIGGSSGCNLDGCGTVFKVTKTGVESVLYAFSGGSDGNAPLYGSLLRDAGGNLYGTTSEGGDLSCPDLNLGCGVVFEVTAGGTESVLHAFAGGTDDGAFPDAGLIADASGNLYGTTNAGGAGGCTGNGCGTVFELAPDNTETILHSFAGGSDDGSGPSSTLLLKGSNLFGTTQVGGSDDLGTIFKLSATGDMMLLYSFTGGDDGRNPYAGLISGPDMSFFGTATKAGSGSCPGSPGCGTVFKLQ